MDAFVRGDEAVVRELLHDLREEFEGNAEVLGNRAGTCDPRCTSPARCCSASSA
jgi:hypothetical protein